MALDGLVVTYKCVPDSVDNGIDDAHIGIIVWIVGIYLFQVGLQDVLDAFEYSVSVEYGFILPHKFALGSPSLSLLSSSHLGVDVVEHGDDEVHQHDLHYEGPHYVIDFKTHSIEVQAQKSLGVMLTNSELVGSDEGLPDVLAWDLVIVTHGILRHIQKVDWKGYAKVGKEEDYDEVHGTLNDPENDGDQIRSGLEDP